MKRAFVLGGLTGLVGALLSIVGNLQRGDPHLVAAYPNLLTLFVVPAGVFWIIRHGLGAGRHSRQTRRLGLEFSTSAAAVWAVVMAAFTLWWVPSVSFRLAAFLFLSTLVATIVVGYVATLVASRRSATAV